MNHERQRGGGDPRLIPLDNRRTFDLLLSAHACLSSCLDRDDRGG